MSAKSEVKLNSEGVVLNEGVHDAAIVDVRVSGEGEATSATVLCKSEQGEQFSFYLEGVRLFSMSFFGSQNVISTMYVLNKADAESHLNSIENLEQYTFEKREILRDSIRQGQLTLVKISPSIGADIVAICRTLKLESVR